MLDQDKIIDCIQDNLLNLHLDPKQTKELSELFGQQDLGSISNWLHSSVKDKIADYSFHYLNIKLLKYLDFSNPVEKYFNFGVYLIHTFSHLDAKPRAARISKSEYKTHFITDILIFSVANTIRYKGKDIFKKLLLNRILFVRSNFYNTKVFKKLCDSISVELIKKSSRNKNLFYSILQALFVIYKIIYFFIVSTLIYINPFSPVRRSIYDYYNFSIPNFDKKTKLLIYTWREYVSLVFILEIYSNLFPHLVSKKILLQISDMKLDLNEITTPEFLRVLKGSCQFHNMIFENLFDELLNEFYFSLNEDPENSENYDLETRIKMQNYINELGNNNEFISKINLILKNKDYNAWNKLIMS